MSASHSINLAVWWADQFQERKISSSFFKVHITFFMYFMTHKSGEVVPMKIFPLKRPFIGFNGLALYRSRQRPQHAAWMVRIYIGEKLWKSNYNRACHMVKPTIMHMGLLCFLDILWVLTWLHWAICPFPSVLLHWDWGDRILNYHWFKWSILVKSTGTNYNTAKQNLNNANLRNLIAVTGPLIILKLE